MNIIQNLGLIVYGCKAARSDKRNTNLCNYLERVVRPRLASYAVFLDLINTLPNEHSLRGDAVTIEILEDYRQLVGLVDRAEEYLA